MESRPSQNVPPTYQSPNVSQISGLRKTYYLFFLPDLVVWPQVAKSEFFMEMLLESVQCYCNHVFWCGLKSF